MFFSCYSNSLDLCAAVRLCTVQIRDKQHKYLFISENSDIIVQICYRFNNNTSVGRLFFLNLIKNLILRN